MKLFLLMRPEEFGSNWDTTMGFVLRAENEAKARKLAADKTHGDEGRDPWLDPHLVTCTEILVDGPEEVILCDFLAG